MQKKDQTCGCAGPGTPVGNQPLFYLANLVASLERQEQERKAKEDRDKLAAMSRRVLGEGS
jgi:hypothetical protein